VFNISEHGARTDSYTIYIDLHWKNQTEVICTLMDWKDHFTVKGAEIVLTGESGEKAKLVENEFGRYEAFVLKGTYMMTVTHDLYTTMEKEVVLYQSDLVLDEIIRRKPDHLKINVINMKTNDPIPDATVSLTEIGDTGSTESNGRYETSVDPDTYTVEVNCEGFDTQTFQFESSQLTLDVFLIPNTGKLMIIEVPVGTKGRLLVFEDTRRVEAGDEDHAHVFNKFERHGKGLIYFGNEATFNRIVCEFNSPIGPDANLSAILHDDGLVTMSAYPNNEGTVWDI
jgi:hypothetical protein